MKRSYLITMLLCFSMITFASQKRKVLILGIDGVRSDALIKANTPVIDSLIANGTYTFNAYHMGITVSGPSWSTVMTGVWEAKHRVTGNSYTGSRFWLYPYFTTRAKEILPDLYSVQIVEWPPLNDKVYNDSWNKKIIAACDGCMDGRNNTSELACEELANDNLDIMFVYYDQADLVGHSSGFNPNNPAYISAIEYVDTRLASVMDCIRNRSNYEDEDWLILLIPDHGGISTGHGGGSKEERQIWWIASGSAVPKQEINAPDPGTYYVLHQIVNQVPPADPVKLKNAPVQADIGVTALHHVLADVIGDSIQEYINLWKLDGKSWLKQLSSPTAVVNNRSQDFNLQIYPNPAGSYLRVWLEKKNNQHIKYRVIDMAGKELISEILPAAFSFEIDCTSLSPGMYNLQVELPGTGFATSVFIKQ